MTRLFNWQISTQPQRICERVYQLLQRFSRCFKRPPVSFNGASLRINTLPFPALRYKRLPIMKTVVSVFRTGQKVLDAFRCSVP
ncbi:TPA: hypothetical protein R4067_004753 [Klebsiella pneumoniae]|nr:hypothetical protein [Salmonella enterica subsp. enterica serovar Enteritidis]THH57406.1 hypothetical protein E9165_24160 [Klebsiella pneumoniae subsp. pneumoniae]HBY5220588.1 hypothetical protein [Klebsiella pneumoniae]HED1210369.1 hypothetical protein [Escherichia coli]HED1492348.1 hypothetical protein [Enterobacter hormaechei subsp. steigerwaltii]HED1793015.1 hypothetical protein [Citrobacter amalonaticus]HED1905073.1 hypothetical protein [Citrobacter farmeri]HED2052439.1 hypothetical 